MASNPAHLSVVGEASRSFGEGPTSRESSSQGGISGGPDSVNEEFIALYKSHYPRLVRALELSGASRASSEDVAQEAFARTLSHWRRVRRGANPAGYVYRVAFRLVRRGRNDELPLTEEPSSPDVANEVALSLELERSIRRMPLAQRRCAVLCLVVGTSTRDAARSLGIAESTVRKQIERARSDLRAVLDTQW